jgi:protein involved in temperature-dependent protein secretion
VDVFETDNQGKLLSFCPTFDNKKIRKTNPASETLRKSSQKFFSMMGKAQKAVAKSETTKRASAQLGRMGIMQHAKNVAENVRHRVGEAVHHMNSPSKSSTAAIKAKREVTDSEKFEQAISAAAEEATGPTPGQKYSEATLQELPVTPTTSTSASRADLYISEASTTEDEATTAEV